MNGQPSDAGGGPPPGLRAELLALLERRLTGESWGPGEPGSVDECGASGQVADRIEEILAAEPSLFPEYLRRIHLHVCLDARFRKPSASTPPLPPMPDPESPAPRAAHRPAPAPPAPGSPAGRRPLAIRVLATAAAAAAVVAVTLWWWGDHWAGQGDGVRPGDSGVAELLRAGNAVWDGPDGPPTVGGRAPRFRLKSGLAEIRCPSGVTAVLQGPADLEVLGPTRARLRRGRVCATVPEGAKGFTIVTPSADVVDLGTEFGVAVDDPEAGAVTTVQVYRGEVMAGGRNAGPAAADARRLTAGQALSIAGGAAAVPERSVEVAFREDRFVRRFPGPEGRRAETGEPATPYNLPVLTELRIRPAPGPVAVDGDFSDWDLTGEFRGRCSEPYGEAYHVRGAMMYDAAGVYIAAVVGDPDPLRNVYAGEENNVWRGGVVQVRLSADPAAGWPVDADNRNGGLRPVDRNPRLVHITMWRSATLGRPCLQLAHGMNYHGIEFNPPGFRGAVLPEPGGRGYRLEYFIPWERLGVADGRPPPRAGDVTAVSWTVHWAYEDGRTWRGQWVDIVNPQRAGWTFQKAGLWGRAVWEGKVADDKTLR